MMTMASIRGPTAALSLYRSILKAHSKHLPQEMKELGDAYVKSEFRLHKTATKPEQLQQFFDAWDGYLHQLLSTARAKETVATGVLDNPQGDPQQARSFEFGKDLPSDLELNEEQAQQLAKLKEEARKARKPES